MAKKDKSKKDEKDEKDSKKDSGKQKIEFNLSDGVSWHDFVGIFVLIGSFFWKLIRLILSPAFWIWGENVRMIRFMRTTDHERILTEDERWFVETIPFIYSLTGLIGGVLIGLFAAFSFSDEIREFLESLSFDFIAAFFGLIGDILLAIWTVIATIFGWIATFIEWIVTALVDAFNVSPFLALAGLLIVGVIIMLIYITVVETGVMAQFTEYLQAAFYWLIGSPERFRLRVNSFYRRFNHQLTILLVGKERIHTRTQIYFKRVVKYTFALSLWSFASGIFIGANPEDLGGLDTLFEKVAFTSMVLFIAGVISGTLFFAFVARLLDLYSRRKYISPQFIKDDVVDTDAIQKHTEEDEKRISKELEVPDVLESDKKKEKVKAKAD